LNKKIALIFLLLLALAIMLSYAASKFTVLPFDLKSYHELQEEASPPFNVLMQTVSYLGETAVAVALMTIVVSTFALRRKWLETIFILSTTCGIFLTFVLKEFIHRARPFPLAESSSGFMQGINQYSYPSGHVLFFVVFFGFLAYLAWIHFAGKMRVIVITICSVLIVLIGPSRVFLGAHFASDVVGGYLIGTIWLILLILAYRWTLQSVSERL
jgi:membrane-associated phospholipid phosphatase